MIRLLLTMVLLQFVFSFAVADSIDLNEELNWEDPLLNNQVVEQMRSGSGYESQGASYQPPQIRSINLGSQIQCPECGRNNIIPSNTGSEINSASIPQSNGTDDDENKNKKKQKPWDQGGSGQSQQSLSRAATGLDGQPSVQVVGGIPYVNTPDEKKDEPSKVEISKANTLASLAPKVPINAVDLNRVNDSGPSKPSGLRGGASSALDGPGASGFGNYEAGGRRPGSMSESAAQSALNKFSKGGYHATDGISSGNSGSLVFKNGKWVKGKKSKKNSKKAGENQDINALNRRLQAQLRRVANHPEFGDAKTFIFKSMCLHYANYALKNQIPRNKFACPEK